MEISKEVRPGDVQSIHRALHLLEAVGAAGDLGVSELAAELGLAISTVHNMLRTLVHRGYLTNVRGRYRLGPAVTALATRWDPIMSLSDTVQEVLSSLMQATGHPAYASVLTGHEMQIIGFKPAPGPFTSNITVGLRDNPMDYATGRILVATTRQRSDWTAYVNAAADIEPRRSKTQWLEDLAYTADHAICVKSDGAGNISIGVPVWMSASVVLAALGVSVNERQASPDTVERVIDILWEHAAALSADLGCTELPATKPISPKWV